MLLNLRMHSVATRRHRSGGWGLVAGLLIPWLILLVGCDGRTAGKPDHPGALVLIVIDTLRGDRLGCSGYERAVTPCLDSLAAAGTRFAAAMTPAPVTLPAVASLLTGRLPTRHGVRDNGCFVLAEDETTLAESLRAAGWRTAAIVGSAVLAADRGLDQGFETYDDEFQPPYPIYDPSYARLTDELAGSRCRADQVTDRALARLEEFGRREPFFLFVHYFDVHMYYDPPPAHAAHHPGNPYDGEVSFVDHEIGRLLAGLAERPDALTVVVADHGESLGEHGEPQHGFLLYESSLHVPWLVAGPGVPVGEVRREPVSLVDLVPTLRRVLRLPADDLVRDGRGLDWTVATTQSMPLYAETFHPLVSYDWSELRAVRLDDWKLIQGGGVTELYDLREDPEEQRGRVSDLSADRRRRLVGLLHALATLVGDDDPEAVLAQARGELDPERRAALESLGYLSSTESRRRGPGPRAHPARRLPEWVVTQGAKHLFRRALHLIDEGELGAGITMIDSALAIQPAMAEAYFSRGEARLQLGDRSGGEADLDRALELGRQQLPGLVALMQQPDAGAGDDSDPNTAAALDFLTRWYLVREEPAAALPYLRRLAVISPTDAGHRFNLGLAAYRSGHPDEARRELLVYLELAPDHPSAELVRRLLDERLGQ